MLLMFVLQGGTIFFETLVLETLREEEDWSLCQVNE